MLKEWSIPFVVALFLMVGCGGGDRGAPPQFDLDTQPPTVSGRLFSGAQTGQFLELPFLGGTVRLEATVSDPSGVALVEFHLSPTLEGLPRPLTPDGQGRVTTSIVLPANFAGADQTYRFRLRVRDNRGNEGIVDVGITVVRSPFSGIPPLPQPPL